ncbi:MAG TPA: DUF6531 domain-containing protein, partial [Gammaproteobacteria bacterium]|nr:DUF6531 domain-containing protein [Gammaproteobacteria bacterium]
MKIASFAVRGGSLNISVRPEPLRFPSLSSGSKSRRSGADAIASCLPVCFFRYSSPVLFSRAAIGRARCFASSLRRTLRCAVNLLAASGLFFGSVVTAQALDAPWQWTVSAISGQTFDSREAAEAALRGLGGVYALATVVEHQTMTETSVTYTYGARSRERYIGPWVYQISNGGPQPSEEAALADAEAALRAKPYVCEFISLVRESDWIPTTQIFKEGAYFRERYRAGAAGQQPPCGGEYNYIANGWRQREISCPLYMSFNPNEQACARHNIATIKGQIQGPPTACGVDTVGNPCSVSTGNKSLEQVDVDLPWIKFRRHYQSQISVPYGGFGNHWTHSLNVHTTTNPNSHA